MGRKARMTQPAAPDSVDLQRRRTIAAGLVTLQHVTRGIAQAVLSGAPLTRGFLVAKPGHLADLGQQPGSARGADLAGLVA